MNILVVGNVIKDVYLNLDSRTENFETDKNHTKWLNLSFNASEHHFFSRASSLGGAAVSLEVLEKLGLKTTISSSDLTLSEDGLTSSTLVEIYRYILVSDEKVTYFAPSEYKTSRFEPPSESYDYLYIDRSAELDLNTVKKINTYLELSSKTKLVLYVRNLNNPHLNSLLRQASLIFYENNNNEKISSIPELEDLPPEKVIYLSEKYLSYLKITENISLSRVDVSTHLSTYSIAAATILGCFILGYSVENSLKMSRANLENSKLNSALSLHELEEISTSFKPNNDLELIAANLLLKNKGILAADESGGSIKKKFSELKIPDTFENRRFYRDIFLSTPDLRKYVNGVILFDETTRQQNNQGRNFVDLLISQRIIPGIKVDQGLEKFENSLETYTKGLDNLDERLKEYYNKGLRFAKWRAAFEIYLSNSGEIITPTTHAIEENCRLLAEYAKKCQNAGIVPIVEPEVVYKGYYTISNCEKITAKILDTLFNKLDNLGVNLRACILKTNMVLAGKNFQPQSTPEEIGKVTAKVLKEHVPEDLAGIVFLSGGQSEEQATENLAEIIKNGPFPWPVTFSFARALQDPALHAWAGNHNNLAAAREAFLSRLIANTEALQIEE